MQPLNLSINTRFNYLLCCLDRSALVWSTAHNERDERCACPVQAYIKGTSGGASLSNRLGRVSSWITLLWIHIVSLVIIRLVINILKIWIFVLTFSMWWQQSFGSDDLSFSVSNIIRSIKNLSSSVSNIVRSTNDSSTSFSCLGGAPVWEELIADS
jgi:hypothetical protein